MKEIKYAVEAVVVCLCVATLISHCWCQFNYLKTDKHYEYFKHATKINLKDISMRDLPLNRVVLKEPLLGNLQMADDMFERQHPEMYILKTPGCKIPLWVVNYRKIIKIDSRKKLKCGLRSVFLRKHDGVTIIASIKTYMLQKQMKFKHSNFYCCYQFLLNTVSTSKLDNKTALSNCTRFKDNSKITLETDFIDIKCYEHTPKNKTFILYEDKFAFTKKRKPSKPQQTKCKIKYNVMMIGLDSMSLNRAEQTLPRTLAYFSNQSWIDYKGYHKIADNTLPNLMAVCTGRNMTSIRNQCIRKMDTCNRHMIWKAFKKAGYITGYGEDNLDLPDTFTNDFEFKKPPTDHYMRPFFVDAEYREKNGTFLCIGNISTGRQILNYALDFAHTYKNETFFGLFWINTFSHDSESRPYAADKMLENFFYRLNQTGVLSSTFVIFFSDHGIRFGDLRFTAESYYDERLPMFFIWTPLLFKQQYPSKYRAIVHNQFRLVTPYDFHSTLLDIIKISTCHNSTIGPPEGCPNCHSLFKSVSPDRTCADVSINDKWCSCHNLYPLSVNDKEAKKNVYAAVKHLQSKMKYIKTKKCWFCMNLGLKKIYRVHFYYHTDNISLFYVVAFSMAPANVSYEAIVFRNNSKSKREIIDSASLINNYKGLGKCVNNRYDRLFCICKKHKKCIKSKN